MSSLHSDVAKATQNTNYKVIADNHCPFCGKGDLEPCSCFALTTSNGKIKPECEGCAG